ncbi:MAG: hypothetical protein Q8O37_17410 [Sulfuricellaceae bacterium]|nr:hypothetical protein [Sulfuricellaceae bacterium]
MMNLLDLFRRKPSGPFADARRADEWLQALRHEDEFEALKKVTEALAIFHQGNRPLTRERLKILFHLDEASQAFQTSLSETYLHHPDALHAGEELLWKNMTTLYARFAHAYQRFIHDLVEQRGKAEFSRYLPTITARALHYYAQEIKWHYFHHEPVQPVMWKRLHKYFLMCEGSQFADSEVPLNSKLLTTCGNEYMQILLLDMIKPAALKPVQIATVDHWLDHWSHLVKLERDCDPETHMHCVDLATGIGARKLLEDMHGESLRCWSMAELYVQVRKSRAGLTDGVWLEHVELGEDCVLPDCIDLLDYVARYWIRPESARQQDRAQVEDRMMEMACGVDAIHSCLQPHDAPVNHKAPFEHWALFDESVGGYGLVEARPTERAKEGKLVLVKPTGHDANWEIGVVRWKKNSETGTPSLGVERLSDAPKQVNLSVVDGSGEPGDTTIKALFLPKLYQRDINSSLIMEPADYREHRLLDMHYRNNIIRIRLTEIVDNSDDWVRTHFEVQAHTARAS